MKKTLGEIKRGDRFSVAGIRGQLVAAENASTCVNGVRVLGMRDGTGFRPGTAMPVEGRSDTKVTVVA